ncbi:MAG: glucosamine-6-phosphate deaminase [Myxococcota bacterium]
MEVVILETAQDVSARAADVVSTLVRRKPQAVLGLATGRTPLGMYAELVRRHRHEALDFSLVTTFNLVGLGDAHPDSYRAYMQRHLFAHVNLRSTQTFVPDGMAHDLSRACEDFEAAIRATGGIDLQVLGLGGAGHIGFNEPTSSLASRTRIKTLTPATLAANGLTRPAGNVPLHVITMGVGTILEARHCLVLAAGAPKAAAVAQMVEGPVTAFVPASALQLHARTTVLVDEAAASRLALGDYYREVHRGKPAWQRERDGV